MELDNLSFLALKELQLKVASEIKRREAQDKVDTLNEVKSLALARGYTLEQLLEQKAKTKDSVTGKVKIKYRNPQNQDLAWTGRGRQPRWVVEWLAQGGTLDSLLVSA